MTKNSGIGERIAVMHNDIRWIRDRMEKMEARWNQWENDHEQEHKSLVIKLIGAIAVISAAVSAFLGNFLGGRSV